MNRGHYECDKKSNFHNSAPSFHIPANQIRQFLLKHCREGESGWEFLN